MGAPFVGIGAEEIIDMAGELVQSGSDSTRIGAGELDARHCGFRAGRVRFRPRGKARYPPGYDVGDLRGRRNSQSGRRQKHCVTATAGNEVDRRIDLAPVGLEQQWQLPVLPPVRRRRGEDQRRYGIARRRPRRRLREVGSMGSDRCCRKLQRNCDAEAKNPEHPRQHRHLRTPDRS